MSRRKNNLYWNALSSEVVGIGGPVGLSSPHDRSVIALTTKEQPGLTDEIVPGIHVVTDLDSLALIRPNSRGRARSRRATCLSSSVTRVGPRDSCRARSTSGFGTSRRRPVDSFATACSETSWIPSSIPTARDDQSTRTVSERGRPCAPISVSKTNAFIAHSIHASIHRTTLLISFFFVPIFLLVNRNFVLSQSPSDHSPSSRSTSTTARFFFFPRLFVEPPFLRFAAFTSARSSLSRRFRACSSRSRRCRPNVSRLRRGRALLLPRPFLPIHPRVRARDRAHGVP